jgi:hypothetical protein
VLLLLTPSLTADTPAGPIMKRAEIRPEIDGVLEDEVWGDLPIVDEFFQNTPRYRDPPSERTVVRIAYDDEFLYIGAEMHDSDPSGIRATQLIQGKSIDADDRFFVTVDTFNSGRNDYFFQVNPNGVRTEALRENNRTFIDEWDTIWYAAAQIQPWGWSAEMAIPFKSISFDPDLDTWSFNFGRWILRKQEFDILASNDRLWWAIDNIDMCCVEGIQQGLGLDVVPSVTLSRKRDFLADEDDFNFEPSLDAFYRLTPTMTAALTINTDFSTAEVDDRQVALDRFLLFFPEKRDFFLQDAGIFEFGNLGTNGRPFFSRRIGLGADGAPINLVGGGKVTGRSGRINLGALTVRQKAHGSVDESTLFVGRASANVLSESSVGVIVTSGDPASNESNSLVGTDFIFRKSQGPFGQILQGQAWIQKTDDEGSDSDDLAFGAGIESPGDRFRVSLNAMEIQENFSPALGFVNRSGIRQYQSLFRYRTRPGEGRWREIDNQIETIFVTDTSGDLLTRDIRIRPFSFRSHGDDYLIFEWQHPYENVLRPFRLFDRLLVPAGVYEFNRARVEVSTGTQRPFSFKISVQDGDFFGGTRLEKLVELQWRQSAHLFLGLSFLENEVELPSGNFTSHLASLRADVAFNVRWSWSTLLQYDNNVEEFRFNSRLRYEPEAGQEMLLIFDHLSAVSPENQLSSVSNDAIMKVAYTLRF